MASWDGKEGGNQTRDRAGHHLGGSRRETRWEGPGGGRGGRTGPGRDYTRRRREEATWDGVTASDFYRD